MKWLLGLIWTVRAAVENATRAALTMMGAA